MELFKIVKDTESISSNIILPILTKIKIWVATWPGLNRLIEKRESLRDI
jgi:hypothetical protein